MSGLHKILFVSSEFPPGPGGIGNHGFNLCKYLSKSGYEVTAVTVSDYTDSSTAEKFDKEQKFRIIRFKRYSSKLKTFSERIKSIKKEIAGSGINLIIFSGRFSIYASLFLNKFKYNLKFISIAHGTDINAGNTIEKLLIKKSLMKMDLIIPVSEFSSKRLPAEIDSKKICVIPNGFDIERITEIKSKSGQITDGRLNLLTVGSVSPRKGQHNVLKAMSKLADEYPAIKYHIAGRIADDSKIRVYTDSEMFKSKVIIHGQVSNERLYELIKNADIFIILSEQQSKGSMEGFGIAILEANYFGLPAIGSRNSGIADAILHGKSGQLVNPESSDEILKAVKEIVNNYSEYSRNAIQWANQHHWSKIILRYSDSINNLFYAKSF